MLTNGDGDVVFQPIKVHRSGLSAAVDGRALIYVHKELELDNVEPRYPATHFCVPQRGSQPQTRSCVMSQREPPSMSVGVTLQISGPRIRCLPFFTRGKYELMKWAEEIPEVCAATID